MDPNETLRRLREDTKTILHGLPTRDPDELLALLDSMAEHFEALDDWLTRGGFLPEDWKYKPQLRSAEVRQGITTD